MCLTIANPSPVPREARAVSAVEALEETRKLALLEAGSVVFRNERRSLSGRSRRRSETCSRGRRTGARCRAGSRPRRRACGAQGKLSIGITANLDFDPRSLRPFGVLGCHALELRQCLRGAERDDSTATLELGEEQHVVDERRDLLNFGANSFQNCGGV